MNSTPITGTSAASDDSVYAKVSWHILPFLFVCYLVAYIDRVNVGFAKLQMLNDLKFSDTVYGLGAGIFFLGYFIFEIPSNIILARVGARRWIARIMITWGIISAGMAFVRGVETFYLMRFLLGIAEAGFFPGVLYYLTQWYPQRRRARVVASFMTGIPLAAVIGGPISGYIMDSSSAWGHFSGWQWLFLVEAGPALILGMLALKLLETDYRSARWLSDTEKEIITHDLAKDHEHIEDHSIRKVLLSKRVWIFSLLYFSINLGNYGMGFWMPQIIKNLGVSSIFNIGLLSAIPFACAAAGMVIIGGHSDRRGERRWHIATCAIVGAVGLLASIVLPHNIVLSILSLSVAMVGILSALSIFWTLPTSYFKGIAAAAGIAMVNALGNLSGFVGPFAIGAIKDLTKSTDAALLVICAFLVLAAVLVTLGVRRTLVVKQ